MFKLLSVFLLFSFSEVAFACSCWLRYVEGYEPGEVWVESDAVILATPVGGYISNSEAEKMAKLVSTDFRILEVLSGELQEDEVIPVLQHWSFCTQTPFTESIYLIGLRIQEENWHTGYCNFKMIQWKLPRRYLPSTDSIQLEKDSANWEQVERVRGYLLNKSRQKAPTAQDQLTLAPA